MRSHLIVLALTLGAGWIAPQGAGAQCCDSLCLTEVESNCPPADTICPDTFPLESRSCRPLEPTAVGAKGCLEVGDSTGPDPADACTGGVVTIEGALTGCTCIGPGCTSTKPQLGLRDDPGEAESCTIQAVNGCVSADWATEPVADTSCGYCPGTFIPGEGESCPEPS